MSTNRADRFGNVSHDQVAFLKRRAFGGCGMIIVESATVDSVMGSSGRNLRVDNESCIIGLRDLVSELHSLDTVAVAQLWHAGPRACIKDNLPLSPSGTTPGMPISRPLEYGEIKNIVTLFVEAGDRSVRAGFDAVEIHAAHGYLLHHFVDQTTNRRRDAYGGAVENRYRVLTEIRAGLASIHPNVPVILRLSLNDGDDFAAIAKVIEAAGFDAVDVRAGFSSMPKTDSGGPVAEGYTLTLARKLRLHLNLPLMTGGRILTPKEAERAIVDIGLDAIVLGRALLADPDWVQKALSGQSIITCRYDCEPSCYSEFKEGHFLRCVYHEGRE